MPLNNNRTSFPSGIRQFKFVLSSPTRFLRGTVVRENLDFQLKLNFSSFISLELTSKRNFEIETNLNFFFFLVKNEIRAIFKINCTL